MATLKTPVRVQILKDKGKLSDGGEANFTPHGRLHQWSQFYV